MSDCYKCGYKGKNPGSAHIRCKYDWEKAKLPMPKGNPHGIKHGWWIFPMIYDPTWMLGECPVFGTEWDPQMVIEEHDPLSEVLAIFASVGR